MGNPFFVREVTCLLRQADGTYSVAADDKLAIPIPGTVREVVRERVRALSQVCQDSLAAASVSGSRFELSVVEALVGEDPLTVAVALADAERAGIIARTGEPGHHQFVHFLSQAALYDDLPADARARLHLLTAQRLESLYQDDLDPRLEELARHYRQAAPLGYSGKAIEYTWRSARRAVERGALESAVAAFDRALALLDREEGSLPRERLELLIEFGEAQTLAADPAAQETLLEAAHQAKHLGEPERFAAAALGYAGLNMAPNLVPREQIALLEEALDSLADRDDALRVRLLGRLAIDIVGTDFDRDRARDLTDEAIDIARGLKDPFLIAWTLNMKNRAFTGPDVGRGALAESREAVDLSTMVGDARLRAMSYMAHIKLLFQLQEFVSMQQAIGEFRDLAEDLRVPYYIAIGRAYEALQQMIAGESEDALDTVAGYRDLFSLGEFLASYQTTLARHDTGWAELSEGRALARWYEEQKVDLVDHALLLLLLCDLGDLDTARSKFQTVAARNFELTGREWIQWMVAMPLLAEACWILGEEDAASDLYERLVRFGHLNSGSSTMFIGCGSAEYHLGLLAMLLRHWDDAVEHLRRALRANESMGWVSYVARSHLALAEASHHRDSTGDREMAALHLNSARDLACQLGMRPLIAAAEEVEKRLEEQDQTGDQHGLTPRQIEVLTLIAQGMSDREIAEELVISHHTVMRHVHNILNRLSVDSRTAAASYGVRSGII